MGVLNRIHTHTAHTSTQRVFAVCFLNVCMFKYDGVGIISYNLLNTEAIFEFETHDGFLRKRNNNNQKRIIRWYASGSLGVCEIKKVNRRLSPAQTVNQKDVMAHG